MWWFLFAVLLSGVLFANRNGTADPTNSMTKNAFNANYCHFCGSSICFYGPDPSRTSGPGGTRTLMRYYPRGILSPLRLPIPPQALCVCVVYMILE